MKEKVTGFPFNTLDHPMYVGSVPEGPVTSLGPSSLGVTPSSFALSLIILPSQEKNEFLTRAHPRTYIYI